MFRKVIPHVLKTPAILNNVRFSNNFAETTKMEKTVNQVTLLGRVGAEPQKRGNANHPVVIFSLATHTNYKYETGDIMQKTEWHRVCVFKPSLRDNVSSYLKKGQRVMISGRLSYGEFKDEEGNTKPSTAVIADDVIYFQ